MKYLSLLLLLAMCSSQAFARTGSVHDDFIIWLAPSIFLLLLWAGYKVKAFIEQRRKAHAPINTLTKTTDC